MTAYDRLEILFRRLATLGEASAMLHWDRATMMPPGGAASRAEQLALLSTLRHGFLNDPEVSDLLDQAEEQAGLGRWQAANLGEMRHRWLHASALSEDLVERLSMAGSACETKWRAARAENDFAGVRPLLQELLVIIREVADAKSQALDCSPYDALLDEYEPGFGAETIDRVFAELSAFLPDFLLDAVERQRGEPDPLWPQGPFPEDAQRALGVKLMERLGFDFGQGRLDTSLHPFSGGTPDDIRITTRFDEDNFAFGLMAVLHETGHALYEKGLPRDWRRQPVGEARGMAMHESQSLLVEMQVCRSREFLEFAAPLMRDAFAASGPEWETDNLYRLYRHVEPGLIRVDADEVTYPAHVIFRYDLERAMISGDLAIADLPGAWNDAMNRMLGITPETDADGCLQDIHWFDGAWGYFPSYTLGAMAAAQLFAAAKRANPEIPAEISKGDFAPLFAWLGENVHGLGSSLATHELIDRATGEPLGAETYKRHLAARYLS